MALSGICGAYFLNRGAKDGLRQTEALISFVRFLRSQIECFSLSVPRTLERCPKEILSGCGYSGEGKPRSISELIEECRIADGASKRHMERLCSDIGKGYRKEQLALCDYCISLLEERRAQLAGQLPLRIKMNSALSIAGAAAIVILLI